jgi:hypothetical protein
MRRRLSCSVWSLPSRQSADNYLIQAMRLDDDGVIYVGLC